MPLLPALGPTYSASCDLVCDLRCRMGTLAAGCVSAPGSGLGVG